MPVGKTVGLTIAAAAVEHFMLYGTRFIDGLT